jgi:hypothetical protein
MQTSRIIEFDGVFIGAAMELPSEQGWRFVAAHPRASRADGTTSPTFEAAQSMAKHVFLLAPCREEELT